MSDAANHVVPLATHESWRTWLMTGARRTPVDRRRMRGGHKGLKKILLEGRSTGGGNSHTWKDFSGAMVRHAVDDAMRALPPEDKQVVKLAYFGGYSNREIAREIGLTEGTVQRRLRRALAAISDHIQTGRNAGRRALYGLAILLSGRWLTDSANHVWTATAVAGAAVVIVATQAAPAAGPAYATSAPAYARPAPASQALSSSETVVPPMPSPTVPVTAPSVGSSSISALVAPPAVLVPMVKLPVQLPIKLPSVLPLRDKIKKPI